MDNVPARLGQHSREVLAEKLAWPSDRLDELTSDGAVVQIGETPGKRDQAGGRDSLALADTADV
jgi:hypothetical protein